eukprot:Lithocolla_globosa_v1_NODE_407_length_4133_cov_91.104463.p5 type:complete len:126 gc:universal NODE_407_length_4133_cov_91.104463:1918-1541(-)
MFQTPSPRQSMTSPTIWLRWQNWSSLIFIFLQSKIWQVYSSLLLQGSSSEPFVRLIPTCPSTCTRMTLPGPEWPPCWRVWRRVRMWWMQLLTLCREQQVNLQLAPWWNRCEEVSLTAGLTLPVFV